MLTLPEKIKLIKLREVKIFVYFVVLLIVLLLSGLMGQSVHRTKKTVKKGTIHKMLYSLSNECRNESFYQAQNTFLDLHLEWQRAELRNSLELNSLTSDSLHVLGTMIDSAAVEGNKLSIKKAIVVEIRRIRDRLSG